MKEYSAYLTFNDLEATDVEKIKRLAEEYSVQADIGSNYLEFDYVGRDTSRNVVKFFYCLSKVVVDAAGEVACEIVNDDGDNEFEFYSIRNGLLICQVGKIIREAGQVVEF
jgi:hypothetical protein